VDRVDRRCDLLSDDLVTGKKYDHLKIMIQKLLQRLTGALGVGRLLPWGPLSLI